MNKGTTKKYQELLQEFSKTPKENVELFTEKYEEVLDGFLNLEEVYTIAAKSSSVEDVKNNKAFPLCALNHKKLPSIWLFSERELAERFVNHFGLIRDGVKYIVTLQEEEIIKTVKEAIFNGVYQFAVDEGKCAMVMVPYDLLNRYLVNNGEEEFLTRKQYELMILFNMMKFNGKSVFAIESDEQDDNGTSILAVDRKGVLNIFDKKEDAEIHKYDIGYGRKEAKELSLLQLRDCLNATINNNVEMMKFEINENIIEVKCSKVLYVLNEMLKKLR